MEGGERQTSLLLGSFKYVGDTLEGKGGRKAGSSGIRLEIGKMDKYVKIAVEVIYIMSTYIVKRV